MPVMFDGELVDPRVTAEHRRLGAEIDRSRGGLDSYRGPASICGEGTMVAPGSVIGQVSSIWSACDSVPGRPTTPV